LGGRDYANNFLAIFKEERAFAGIWRWICRVGVSDVAKQGANYVIKFLAKSANSNSLGIYFINDDQARAYFGTSGGSTGVDMPGDNEWHLYELNLTA